MSLYENTKQRALAKGRQDALRGETCHSLAKAGSMWDKYYWIGHNQIPVDSPRASGASCPTQNQTNRAP